MKKLLSTLVLSLALAPAAALACDGDKKESIQTVDAAEAAKLAKAKTATFVDANGADTRQKMGVIPGAILLTSSSEYELKELPAAKDQKLVFYCASERCSAAKMAAKRAIGAGYADVWVLPAGIKGWKESGNATVVAAAAGKDGPKS